MITKLTHSTVWVLDQDAALRFYTEALGFEVRTDVTMDSFRWLTVGPPESDIELILAVPGPPMLDPESAGQIRAMVAKGRLVQPDAARLAVFPPSTFSSSRRWTPASRRGATSTASRRGRSCTAPTGCCAPS
jgi:catechol 2,3-dioxygenase-like lactoylglutathione lyase family enzyme